MAWLGTRGLRELAVRCARATRYTRESLLALDGIEPFATAPVLREFAVLTPIPADQVVDRMAEEGFLAGIALDTDDYGDGLLVAVTERRTREEIDAFVATMQKVAR
jgi:glycine dehydrogenase subunit 1